MTTELTRYATHDDWLAANPLFKWRTAWHTKDGVEVPPQPMEAIAQQVGATRTSVMFWERGEFMPKHKYMVTLAAMMGVKFATLYANWQHWWDAQPVTTKKPRRARALRAA